MRVPVRLRLVSLVVSVCLLVSCGYAKYGIRSEKELASTASIPSLIRTVGDPDPAVRKKAVTAMGDLASSPSCGQRESDQAAKAVDWVAEKDADYGVREAAKENQQKIAAARFAAGWAVQASEIARKVETGARDPVAAAPSEKRRLAVLEFTNDMKAQDKDVEALADDVRQAALILPRAEYLIMTRENMMMMLPPGTDLSQCSEGQCEVESGKKVGADLVVSGILTTFQQTPEVRLKLFDTATGELLGQRTARGADLGILRDATTREAEALFQTLLR